MCMPMTTLDGIIAIRVRIGSESLSGFDRNACPQSSESASMALRWTAAAMQEAAKGFRRLKACKQLPLLRAALAVHQAKHADAAALEHDILAA